MSGLRPGAAPRPLGRTQLRAFPLAYGCWRFAGASLREARAKIDAALGLGVTLFDHADIYGGDGAAERLFGDALAEAPGLRDRMLIASKGGIVPGVPYDSSPAHVRAACEASLRRLRVEVIDLYQLHRPDWLMDPEPLAAELDALHRDGKIRAVGVSNFRPSQVDALQRFLPCPIATQQPELSPWVLDPLRDGVLDQCLREHITPLAWSPLAGGRLGLGADAARREPHGARLAELIELLDSFATRQGVSRTAVVLAFLLVHPAGIIPILGTQRVERIADAADAFKVELTRADWYAIVSTSLGERLP
ncbi:MAG: aldo/keto reductase [Deltaproteobacteria bacterium]|nr:aldo/keto reductase [Deltaproteobacteria bacterium]